MQLRFKKIRNEPETTKSITHQKGGKKKRKKKRKKKKKKTRQETISEFVRLIISYVRIFARGIKDLIDLLIDCWYFVTLCA